MGRRSSHKPDELRELIITAATEVIDRQGLVGLSAREIARKISYSPGTIYNIFEDLDDVILTIEQRQLDRLALTLSQVPRSADPVRHLRDLAAAYLAFTQEKPRLWNLLLEHYMPTDWQVPAPFQAKLESLMDEVGTAVVALTGSKDAEFSQQHARVLWAGVHGITSLATAAKMTNITQENARTLVDDLVVNYATGLEANSARPPKKR